MNIVQALAWLIWQPRLGEQMYHKYQFFFETNDLLNIGQLSSAWQNTTSCIYLYKLKNLFLSS